MTFTMTQRAELRDAAARSLIEYREERAATARLRAEERKAERAAAKMPRKRKPDPSPLPPKSEPVTPAVSETEAELALRLLPHVCAESVIDRERHALCVARTVLKLARP